LNSYGDLLVCILLDILPSDVRKSVARQHTQDELTLKQFRNALKAELRVMEAVQLSSIPANQPSKQQNSKQSVITMYNGVNNGKPTFRFPCVFCSADHPVAQCTNVLSIEDSRRVVQEKRLLFQLSQLETPEKELPFQGNLSSQETAYSSLYDNTKSASSTKRTSTLIQPLFFRQ
jgi:hypothetical protein